ncbi:hypothetical protein LTR96_000638 [Exophiala xenobiotica]|nr:hypothetical protein LTR96_000638 [Exophiala xenobiotica]KAK5343367.1 hypothetical protein LTR98_000996 [Exophiala xenobiotica]
MSLRMSSLDPDEPRAMKDCRTCNRRRIKCDRSLETCRKCALKGLPCPGYGLRIRWDQGIASRGKLAGKVLPILGPAPASYHINGNPAVSLTNTPAPLNATPSILDSVTSRSPLDIQEENVVQSTPIANEPHIVGDSLRNIPHPVYDHKTIQNKFSMNLDMGSYRLPNYLQPNVVRDLIHYYDHVVAAVMPWVDGPDNAWRTIMLPLAMKSESLLLAILALSAEHYSSKMGSTWLAEGVPLAVQYRDQSVQLLAQNLRTELAEDPTAAHQGPACAMLATILVLCNLEMIRCDSAIWHVHWKAARTITRRWTSSHHPRPMLEYGFKFLIKEAFVYDVFGSSTTFDNEDQIPNSVLTDEEDPPLFGHWLQLVQEVTIVERRRHANMPADQYLMHSADMKLLQSRFHEATSSSLHISRGLDFESQGLQSDIVKLLNIYHEAGLLYSYQALLGPKDSALARDSCVESIINSVRYIENLIAFQHDLVWPLFLVGTESRNRRSRQKFAESGILEAMRSTAFSNCRPALEFLRRFWTTDQLVVMDWIQFGRQESQRGLNFLVI